MTMLRPPTQDLGTLGEARGLVATAVRWHAVDPISVFVAAAAAGVDACLWHQPATGRSLVGIDVVARLAPQGIDRFAELEDGWRALRSDIGVEGPAADSPLAGPMLIGGATFRDHPSADPRWSGFETAAFDVPRVLLATRDDQTVLTRVEPADGPGASSAEALVDRLLGGHARTRGGPAPAWAVAGTEPDRPAWGSSVARITGAVGRGRLDKVVLARRADLVANRPIDLDDVLARLEAADRGDPSPGARLPSTVFAFARRGRTFLGSSPELIASVRGGALRTMALAGTTGRGVDAAADAALGAALLASEKDREEHAVVATMLRATLAPLVTDLALPRAPRIVRTARLQHLLTDVTANLRPDVGLLDVVRLVHPTPAVAGWPTDAALELLDEESALDRGWYAGPVGWVDRLGDGDMAVAIRSGVVAAHEASLFAGCGIVADSEPDREWDESTLKMRVMGDALGWDAT